MVAFINIDTWVARRNNAFYNATHLYHTKPFAADDACMSSRHSKPFQPGLHRERRGTEPNSIQNVLGYGNYLSVRWSRVEIFLTTLSIRTFCRFVSTPTHDMLTLQ